MHGTPAGLLQQRAMPAAAARRLALTKEAQHSKLRRLRTVGVRDGLSVGLRFALHQPTIRGGPGKYCHSQVSRYLIRYAPGIRDIV
jgi:hypothetical protein